MHHPLAITLRDQTVLVVDDEAEVRVLLQRQLEQLGCITLTARDGFQALGYLESDLTPTPAAIVLDLRMPGMDGWQVLERLGASPRLRQIPVILATVVGDVPSGYRVLHKPFRMEDLEQVLAQAVVH